MPSKITLPTYITLIRMLLVPVFIYFYLKERYLTAVAIFVVAGLTDGLDGFMARRFNMRSRLGSLLDPAADKVLMLASLLLLSFKGQIPWAFTSLVVGRDVLISIGVGILNLMKIRLYYKPTIFSKMATVSQITVITLSFLEVLLLHHPETVPPFTTRFIPPAQNIFLMIAAGLTVITVFQYGYFFYKYYRYGERKG